MLVLRVAIHSPLRRLFDYLPPRGEVSERSARGRRVRVPFGAGNRVRVGVVVALASNSEVSADKLKRVLEWLDEEPLFTEKHLQFIEWASRYYHHSVGDVIFTAMPTALRQGKAARAQGRYVWRIVEEQRGAAAAKLARAPKQMKIYRFVGQYSQGVSSARIASEFGDAGALPVLAAKGLIERVSAPDHADAAGDAGASRPSLNAGQRAAVTEVEAVLHTYQAFLLQGVTGSGKTEVYLRLMERALSGGLQTLVLTPEIGLTLQFVERIRERFGGDSVAVLHSGLSHGDKLRVWLAARAGSVPIVLGTRSVIWAPTARLGMIIFDEEHDLSYKQREGLRYSARDLAVVRAEREGVPILLGSATPSMESIRNVSEGRYRRLELEQRANNAPLPPIRLYDVRKQKMHGAVSHYLLQRIEQVLSAGLQVLLFLNRRGYSPVLMCHECGGVRLCPHCDAPMTFHKRRHRLHCHHCDRRESLPEVCADCSGTQLLEIGHGTERIEETLAELLPDAAIVRIDRDSARSKGRMQEMLNAAHLGDADVLIGTQMLAKGHHFHKLALVGVVDVDRSLFSADFRANERMAQLLMQVSGRAGRGDVAGEVIVQTHYPEHPLLRKLAQHDYRAFTRLLLEERRQTQLPPFSFQALLRVEARHREVAEQFLEAAAKCLLGIAGDALEVYGPMSAPMEKRAGRHRYQLLAQAASRAALAKFTGRWIDELEKLPVKRRLRWSLDIDPQEMS